MMGPKARRSAVKLLPDVSASAAFTFPRNWLQTPVETQLTLIPARTLIRTGKPDQLGGAIDSRMQASVLTGRRP